MFGTAVFAKVAKADAVDAAQAVRAGTNTMGSFKASKAAPDEVIFIGVVEVVGGGGLGWWGWDLYLAALVGDQLPAGFRCPGIDGRSRPMGGLNARRRSGSRRSSG